MAEASIFFVQQAGPTVAEWAGAPIGIGRVTEDPSFHHAASLAVPPTDPTRAPSQPGGRSPPTKELLEALSAAREEAIDRVRAAAETESALLEIQKENAKAQLATQVTSFHSHVSLRSRAMLLLAGDPHSCRKGLESASTND